jgi:hypothetical protein
VKSLPAFARWLRLLSLQPSPWPIAVGELAAARGTIGCSTRLNDSRIGESKPHPHPRLSMSASSEAPVSPKGRGFSWAYGLNNWPQVVDRRW